MRLFLSLMSGLFFVSCASDSYVQPKTEDEQRVIFGRIKVFKGDNEELNDCSVTLGSGSSLEILN